MASTDSSPKDILIVGAGVFGLSTAIALLERPQYNNSRITVIDSSQTLPNPVGSSVDASRIIRADYANPSYAKLACLAQTHWRDQTPAGWGGQGRYTQTGFVLTGEQGQEAYVREAMHNVQDLARQGLPMELDKIQQLNNLSDIRKATGLVGVSGETGYANWNSGWADAEACVAFAINKIKSHPNNEGRVSIKPNTKVAHLTFAPTTQQCTGVQLTNSTTISANLTILATGAWTPSILNLSNRALATGQALAFVKLTQQEQDYLADTPVTMNFARGTFIIAPHPQTRELKIARHGFGYRNPTSVTHASSEASKSAALASAQVSVPRTDTQIPVEAERALRDALAELFPPMYNTSTAPPAYPESLRDISKRPFTNSRLCWYTDTPSGNFIIDYPPLPTATGKPTMNKSLFIATGGSGHGFKFFPILGSYIIDAVEGKLEEEYRAMWAWPSEKDLKIELGTKSDAHSGSRVGAEATASARDEVQEFLECEDGSRGGPRGMILEQELQRGVVQVKEARRGQSSMTPKL
ncbi:hypothetical protein PMZ80_007544 [Knufia obscura]|uniref:FAD dependent oxidoreductase domain-containing protein n=2 Tax=Knufia TaxID=430999 RepID=A0AAN8F9S5_9EURO|nr:hypothetical protein PMZ80_007544 [Knufia obscura]KAK5954086.1 hypothetical protein OHC33_004657 [Knufia fluminis]